MRTSVTRPVARTAVMRRSCSRGSPGRAGASRRAPRPARASAPRSPSPSAPAMIRPTSRKSSSSKPRIVAAGVPIRTPEATVGGRSSNGTVFRFTVSCTSSSRSSASLPVQSVARRSSWRRCVSVPPVSDVEAARDQPVGERVGVRAHLLPGRRGTPPSAAIRKHVAFAAIACTSGPPCIPGKTARSTRLRVLLAGRGRSRRAGPASVLCVVEVTKSQCVDRVRVQPRRDEPGEVGHVAHQQRADLVRDLAELGPSRRCAGRRSRRTRSASAGAPSPARAPRRSRRVSSRARRRSGRSCRAARRS